MISTVSSSVYVLEVGIQFFIFDAPHHRLPPWKQTQTVLVFSLPRECVHFMIWRPGAERTCVNLYFTRIVESQNSWEQQTTNGTKQHREWGHQLIVTYWQGCLGRYCWESTARFCFVSVPLRKKDFGAQVNKNSRKQRELENTKLLQFIIWLWDWHCWQWWWWCCSW